MIAIEPIDFEKWDNLSRARVQKTDEELITELVKKFNKLLELL